MSEAEAVTDVRDVASAPADVERLSQPVQPLPAAASFEAELRELVADLRAVIVDLRRENRELREALGKKDATVVDLSERRGKR